MRFRHQKKLFSISLFWGNLDFPKKSFITSTTVVYQIFIILSCMPLCPNKVRVLKGISCSQPVSQQSPLIGNGGKNMRHEIFEKSSVIVHPWSSLDRLFLQGNLFNFILKNNPAYCWMGKLSGKPCLIQWLEHGGIRSLALKCSQNVSKTYHS